MSLFRKPGIALRPILFLAIVLLVLVPGIEAKKGRFINLNPSGERGVTLSLNGKEQTYFLLNSPREMRLSVEGPGTLRVFSRLNFTPELKGLHKYTLEIREGEKIVGIHSSTGDRSRASYKSLKFIPGKSRKFSLDVPAGSHTYTFFLKEAPSGSVSLRFAYDSDAGSSKLASITPLSYSKVVTAFIKEKLVSYFVATSDYDVKLRVIGPTQVRVVSRLNYDSAMKGEQKFAVLVIENGKLVVTKPLQTTKSVGVIYKDWKQVVPGKSQTFFLDVPTGVHTYSFKLTESVAQSVSLRFSIPEKNLSNVE